MRLVTDHIVENDPAPQLEIRVMDEPGAGGANHMYEIHYKSNPESMSSLKDTIISFQNGPIKEVGVNGLTGPFACPANAVALRHCEEAMWCLQQRTRDRMKRGVEGTSVK